MNIALGLLAKLIPYLQDAADLFTCCPNVDFDAGSSRMQMLPSISNVPVGERRKGKQGSFCISTPGSVQSVVSSPSLRQWVTVEFFLS